MIWLFPGYKWCHWLIGPTILAFLTTLDLLFNAIIQPCPKCKHTCQPLHLSLLWMRFHVAPHHVCPTCFGNYYSISTMNTAILHRQLIGHGRIWLELYILDQIWPSILPYTRTDEIWISPHSNYFCSNWRGVQFLHHKICYEGSGVPWGDCWHLNVLISGTKITQSISETKLQKWQARALIGML